MGSTTSSVEVAGRPDLASDPRFATNAERVRHRDVLVPLLAEVVRGTPARFWAEGLEAVGVPCGPINDLAQVFDNPQVQSRGMRIEMPHPRAGKVKLVRSPMKM